MKVTICSYDGKDYFGGPYEWVKRFGPALRDQGVEVSFLFLSDHKASVSSTYQYLKSKGFECRLLQVHSWTNYTDNTEDRVRWFLKQVKDINPDFFIANSVLPALYAGRWVKEWGIPVIGVLHSDDPTQDYIYDEFITGEVDFSLSGIVAVSHLLSERVLSNNPNALEVKTISCGTPIPLVKAHYDEDLFKIIYAGKLTDFQKRITETIYGLCEVVKQIPGVVVEIYGSGSEETNVKNIIEEQAVAHSISFKGLIDSDKIQEVYASAQVFVLLSDFEGLPVALMEAMSTGLVPICTNIKSGIPQLVKDEYTGLLVNDRRDELMKAVKRLKGNPELWNFLSQNASDFVIKEHAMSRVVEEWLLLFQSMSSSSKKDAAIPGVLLLPSVHPSLIAIDVRKSSFLGYCKDQWERYKKAFFRVAFLMYKSVFLSSYA